LTPQSFFVTRLRVIAVEICTSKQNFYYGRRQPDPRRSAQRTNIYDTERNAWAILI
jgi:hypothetical protein